MVDRKIFTIIGDNSTEYEYYRARKLLKDKPTITDKLKLVLPFWFLRFCNYSQESFEKIVVIIKPDSPFKVKYV